MPNKSLEDHLFSRALPPLPWIKRLQIILGAAEGLAYLHDGLEVKVQLPFNSVGGVDIITSLVCLNFEYFRNMDF